MKLLKLLKIRWAALFSLTATTVIVCALNYYIIGDKSHSDKFRAEYLFRKYLLDKYSITFEESGTWSNISDLEPLGDSSAFLSVTLNDSLYTYSAYLDAGDISNASKQVIRILAVLNGTAKSVKLSDFKCVVWYSDPIWTYQEIDFKSIKLEILPDYHDRL